jgi:integrase/recombinase XerD
MATAALKKQNHAANLSNWAATGKSIKGMDWSETYTLFLRSRRLGIYGAHKPVRETTIAHYQKVLKLNFIEFMQGRKRTHYNQMTEEDVLEYLESIVKRVSKQQISEVTRHTYLRALKSFFKWVEKDPACKDAKMRSYAELIGQIPRDQGRQWIPTPEVMKEFMMTFNQSVRWGLRDYVMTSVILDCGARVGELCFLRLSHLQIEGDTPQLLIPEEGKTGMRAVPVDKEITVPLLKKWLRERERFAADHDFVFVNKFGGKLTTNAVRQSFEDHRKRTGLGISEHGNLTVHTVRHFFCTYYLVNGGALHNLQRITGHKQVQTLMIYVHLANQIKSVAEEHSRVSPLKNLGSGIAKKKRKVV